MRLPRHISYPCIALCLMSIALTRAIGQTKVVDRIVAVADGHVITSDDWETQCRYEALMQGQDALSIRLSPAVLERTIDRTLVSSQIAGMKLEPPSVAEVQAQFSKLRSQFNVTSDEAWARKIAEYGLTTQDIAERLTEEMTVLHFIEVRLHSSVHVSPDQISAYYRDRFVPVFRKKSPAGTPVPAENQVTEQITRVLTEERVTERFNNWLQGLRAQARIIRLEPEIDQKPIPLASRSGNQ